ncbi:MAG: transposase [Firmicutes bacterium]|nr:transposase [Bacillota bacterium]
MATQDTIGKWYMSDNAIFADAFNFLLYDGEPVIKPEKLREADTTEIALPYGNNARLTVQKYRDVKKIWAAKEDGKAVYILLGDELQSKVHYAMPVKDMLYDAIDYSKQVEDARRSYQKSKDDDGEFSFENGDLRIRLTGEEFLSGFRKTDRLMPVITATIYFGPDEWDGPLSLHDMMDVEDKRLLRAIPNYWINLIAPARIDDADFEKFRTDLGLAMKVLKYQDKGTVRQVIWDLGHRKVGRSTAEFLNVQAKLGLVFEEPAEEGEVDMCKGMEMVINSERADATENNLLQNIRSLMETVKFTAEQAMNALKVPTADQPRLAGLL